MTADFFSAWNLFHICHIPNSFYTRMMLEEDERPPNKRSHAYLQRMWILLTDPSCNSCSPQMTI